METLAQLEAMCERLYNSQDSVERAHAESTLKCFSSNADYISQCQYLLDNASSPYALMLASSSLLKQVTEQSLPLQLRIDIRNILACLQLIMTRNILGAIYIFGLGLQEKMYYLSFYQHILWIIQGRFSPIYCSVFFGKIFINLDCVAVIFSRLWLLHLPYSFFPY